MPIYRVKEGHEPFLDGSLRAPGYEHETAKKYARTPVWAEEIAKRTTRKAKEAKPQEGVSFADTDIPHNPTVSL